MNKLILIYNKMCKDLETFNKYIKIGKGNFGNKFSFIGTNSRGILPKKGETYGGFYNAFSIINQVELIPRNNWNNSNKSGQEKEKQHTVKMKETSFFMIRDNKYIKTHRGTVFEKMVESKKLSDNDKKFLCYLLILSGNFSSKRKYILEKCEEVFHSYQKLGIDYDEIFTSIKKLIKNYNENILKRNNMAYFDYLYYDSFSFDFKNHEFLKHYNLASNKEKEEFKNYINESFRQNKTQEILSKKYENGGNYTILSLIDNAWILLVTKSLILQMDLIASFDAFINVLINIYSSLFEINVENVKNFIYDTTSLNKSVFQVIYFDIFNIKILNIKDDDLLSLSDIERTVDQIDSTIESESTKKERVIVSLKKIARKESNYMCECHELENCKYFKSKETGENFLKIHHLIPREFGNYFDSSIEKLSNYVPLCPNCHRKIHFSIDNDRRKMIEYLFNKRKNMLKNDKIFLKGNEIFDYYNFS